MAAQDHLPVQAAYRILGSQRPATTGGAGHPPLEPSGHGWLTDVIAGVHRDSRETYGAPRVHAELTMGLGNSVGHCANQMLMARAGIQGLTGRPRFRRIPHVATQTTSSSASSTETIRTDSGDRHHGASQQRRSAEDRPGS
jgi:hypothetical protein